MTRVYLILGVIILILITYFIYNSSKRLNRIINFINKNDRILDFGCGRCCQTYKLKQLGYNVQGIDINNHGVCMTPKLYDGININYPDNYFDIVICSFVLHHIPTFKNTLKELKRITKKYILIYEDTPKTKFEYALTSIHGNSNWGKCNRCFKTTDKWISIFNGLGFDLVFVDKISGMEFPFADHPWFYPVSRTFFVIKKNRT